MNQPYIEIHYTNESGYKCVATLYQPDKIDHVWWSHKRNMLGEFDKHEVTVLDTFLSKINKPFSIKMKNS